MARDGRATCRLRDPQHVLAKADVPALADNWYKVGNTTPDSPFYQALMKKGDAVELNSTVTAYVVNGVIYYANAETAGSTDTALVLAAPGPWTQTATIR